MPAVNTFDSLIPPWPTAELWCEANGAVAVMLQQCAGTVTTRKASGQRHPQATICPGSPHGPALQGDLPGLPGHLLSARNGMV